MAEQQPPAPQVERPIMLSLMVEGEIKVFAGHLPDLADQPVLLWEYLVPADMNWTGPPDDMPLGRRLQTVEQLPNGLLRYRLWRLP